MSNYGSMMIDFNKAGMKDALGRIASWTGKSSPRFWIGEGDFPVHIWYSKPCLSLDGKMVDIIRLDEDGELRIRKEVRLR